MISCVWITWNGATTTTTTTSVPVYAQWFYATNFINILILCYIHFVIRDPFIAFSRISYILYRISTRIMMAWHKCREHSGRCGRKQINGIVRKFLFFSSKGSTPGASFLYIYYLLLWPSYMPIICLYVFILFGVESFFFLSTAIHSKQQFWSSWNWAFCGSNFLS